MMIWQKRDGRFLEVKLSRQFTNIEKGAVDTTPAVFVEKLGTKPTGYHRDRYINTIDELGYSRLSV